MNQANQGAPALTPQQARAIATRDSAVALDAGAGCGKTFVLTRRYLSHLAPEAAQSPSRVVALTFTEAAAREMRDRIRKVCRENYQASAGAERAHWLEVLRGLEGARISTIHAFCNELVSAHAIELGISPGVRVLDAPAAAAMRSAAADRALRGLLESRDEETMRLAVELNLGPLRSGALAMAEHAATPEFARWQKASPEDAVKAWRRFYTGVVEPEAVRAIVEGPELRELVALLRVATPTERFIDRCTDLFDLTSELLRGEATADQVRRLAELAVVTKPDKTKACTAKDWPSGDVSKQYTAACGALGKAIAKRLPTVDETDWLEAAERGKALLRIAALVAQHYEGAKRDAEALDFDDQLALAHRLLTEPRYAEVRHAARDGVAMLLIDEFQDTDRLQLEIVRALAGEDWAAGGLFFVGDFKQSIYRFRGAEPEVFRELREETPERGRLVLSNNFRSTPGVLAFVNAMFAPVFGAAYEPLEATRDQQTPAPAVEFLWTMLPEQEKKPKAEERRTAEARAIARRIGETIASAEPVVADAAGPRAARPSDFCLLFRALSDVAIYEEALREAGLEYYLVGGHAFYNQQEVFDVLNLLRSVTSGCDEVSLAGVLRSPFFSLADETLLWLAVRHGSLSRGLAEGPPAEVQGTERAKLARAAATLGWLREHTGRLGAADLLLAALDRTGYDAALALDYMGGRKQANLRKLIDQARDADSAASAAPSGGVGLFVRQLDEFVANLPKEAPAAATASDANVVRLMTVHQSKGLEFPIVVVADLSRKSRNHSPAAVFDPLLGPLVRSPAGEDGERTRAGIDLLKTVEDAADRAEAQRLFYVACTRAADRLILSASVEDLAKPGGESLELLATQFDLETGERLGEESLQPLVEVRWDDGAPLRGAARAPKRVDRRALVAEARAGSPAGAVASLSGVAPIAADPAAQRRFSISRLTGRLHAYRPRSDDTPAAGDERPAREAIDPAGLGTLVHELMERMPLSGDAPLDEWARDLAPQHTPFTPAAAAEAAAAMAGRFRASPRAEQMRRARRVLREMEFLLPWGEPAAPAGVYLQGYLDCLCEETPGVWRVVDYKTNDVTAAQAPRAAEAYRLQLGVYALAVERAWNPESVALTLHFLRPGVEVDLAWDAEARAATLGRVSELIAELRTHAP
ncbi:UvrD-helicase domain-containing protein [Pirellulimonas nuda]|uniref:UvrD-helicase domain-containing protein n=1 Tax=Pirellulimonas nuda TaxID=2528009 RepID=UPI0018D321FE|nr:UvrD-helicase domain-containing protein [Pirellulimonas nuda]